MFFSFLLRKKIKTKKLVGKMNQKKKENLIMFSLKREIAPVDYGGNF